MQTARANYNYPTPFTWGMTPVPPPAGAQCVHYVDRCQFSADPYDFHEGRCWTIGVVTHCDGGLEVGGLWIPALDVRSIRPAI